MLLLVFGAAKIAAGLFERIGQPGLVGEIIAGMLLGPSVLNWVKPDATLTALAELGVMFLLFRVGLEIKGSELFKVGKTALLVAIAGVLLPFAASALLSVVCGQNRIEAIFVGAAAVATSVGITAQVLAVKGLLDERASRVILAAAVIDDILGLLVLAMGSGMAESHIDVPGLLTTAAIAVCFTFIVARFGTSTVKRWYPTIERRMRAKESQFHFALISVFALSFLAVYVGVAAIVGSFLAGMAFSEASDRRMQDLTHGATELLVPFFLVGIGLHLNLASFRDSGTIIFAIALTAVAVLTKFIGCGIPALVYGRKDATRVGVGMLPRGEVGMIVAQIGLRLGVVGQSVYAAGVFMALLTTLVTPPLLNFAFRDCKPQVGKEEFGLV